MRERNLLLGNLFLHLSFLFLLTGVQTSLWPLFFGSFPTPSFFLVFLVYFGLYRKERDGIIFAYLAGIALTAFTSMPIWLLLILFLSVFFLSRFVKSHIFWQGASYDILLNASMVLVFHLLHKLYSWIWEENPSSEIAILVWIVEILFAIVLSPFLFSALRWIDALTDQQSDTGAGAKET